MKEKGHTCNSIEEIRGSKRDRNKRVKQRGKYKMLMIINFSLLSLSLFPSDRYTSPPGVMMYRPPCIVPGDPSVPSHTMIVSGRVLSVVVM